MRDFIFHKDKVLVRWKSFLELQNYIPLVAKQLCPLNHNLVSTVMSFSFSVYVELSALLIKIMSLLFPSQRSLIRKYIIFNIIFLSERHKSASLVSADNK